MGDEGISCDLSICYIVYKSDKGIGGVTSFIGVKVNTVVIRLTIFSKPWTVAKEMTLKRRCFSMCSWSPQEKLMSRSHFVPLEGRFVLK